MGCECPCGNEYGFRPLGFWICHRCGSLNDSGPVGSGKRSDVMDPDRVDGLVRDGTEFAGHADASVRAHPDSWEAWYSLGATYAARGNLTEAGLMFTKAAGMQGSSDRMSAVMSRCASLMATAAVGATVGGGRCNMPFVYGLEYVSIHRTGGGESFCWQLHDRMVEALEGLGPRESFVIRNMASVVMTQRMRLIPDIREHASVIRRILGEMDTFCQGKPGGVNPMKRALARKAMEYTSYLSEPYRTALGRIEAATDSSDDGRLDELASAQPDDGSAGFVSVLCDALSKGADLAYLRASKADQAEIDAMRRDMEADLDRYVSMFMSGDAAESPEHRLCGPLMSGL